ncbi:hypothetical protein IQ238_07420 [Pleurocapsales cyanobacterium LEGE 06147]|nr:hypothetical protein [Pleurocapsales cyanobacterium LEGE 06147]
MNNKFTSLLIVFFPLSFFFALATEGIKAVAQTNTANRYPPEYVREYMEDCVKESMAEGLPEEEAKTLCTCTLNRFQQQYTLDEFKKLTEASKTDQTAADALITVGESCLEEILYEQ